MDKRKTAKHGLPQKKPKPKFVYKPKQSTAGASTSGTKNQGDVKEAEPVVSLHNKYDMLGEGGSNSGNLNGQSSSELGNNAVDGRSKEDKNPNNQKSNLEGDEELIDPCQPEISSFMSANKKKGNSEGASTPGDTESHVEVSKLSKVCNRVFRQWEWTSNGGVCNRGTRIIIGWNSDLVDLMVLAQTDQVVHVKLKSIALDTRVFVSFVYAKNTYQERRDLWRDLMMHKLVVNNQPWIVLGDFNSALYLDDVLHGSSNPTIGMRDFFECVQQTELLDIPGHGLHFTWNQKPREGIGILKKIDRVMGNLDDIHRQIDLKPFDVSLRDNETELIKKFHIASYDEESFLKQKAKLEWLSAGDGNTSFFHNFVKSRNARNKIHLIRDANGIQHEGVDVEKALVDHYANFLGIEAEVEELNMDGLFVNTVNPELADHMIRPVTREEVKAAMFSIADNKAPGPDGYTSVFFKKAWDVVGDEVSTAILQFFENGKLLQQVNHTIIALIPKVSTPASVLEYRPISCCNVILKCISKILSERIKGSLGSLVDISQSAFIPGRKISDNILLTQELMHNYHLHKGKPRCAFKIDIQKAYDTVSWKFLKSILTRFGFPPKMVGWIMTCVSTVSFSLCINGNLCGYFKGRRGLRQGDPISPYLFTLVMEVLSLLLHKAADDHPAFWYHDKCKLQKIINVSFADDLFIFANPDLVSIRIMRDALELFTRTSGLNPNLAKSTVFFSNVSAQMKQAICSFLPFQEGELPVKYLGVPLISTKLSSKDCKILVDRVDKKIDHWLNKSLSFAGRLQLINSVISAMHVYWASVFMLPVRIVTDIEKRMRNFLWSGGVAKGSTPKVAWKNVCLPKSKGGLGIRRIHDSNKALLTSHVWSILTKRDSLWVRWVHSYRIKGRNFWELPFRGSMTWGWRKMLSIRSFIRPFIWFLIRDGTEANAWNDNWCAYSPLRDFITPRRIHGAGFSMRSSVSDLIDTHNGWKWPIAWFDLYPVLINLMPPNIVHNVPDKLVWKNRQGNVSEFSASEAWESIRVRGEEVDWVNLVWYGQSIPRHSFHLWLVIKNKLKTQDQMGVWDAGSATNLNLMWCPLCNQGKDSRDHLFFRCSYALQVWNRVKEMAYMDSVDENWDSIIAWLSQHAINNSAKSIVSKLVVAASSYFIWQERNNRLFSRTQRNATVIANIVLHTVRLKLMTFKAGKGMKHPLMLERWKFQVKALSIDPG
ncbi:uncharacterized protein LOC110919103 [Helianthus annuus]|uniref:uncharacterized protein LOC110919103 n=1 Tax=Helianthus annuus TaxID=4232 RepID=UPI000B9036AE|nr:uncharacterized protein LOC110919103 [Helianthus annuus]